jgi:hypothetical protein
VRGDSFPPNTIKENAESPHKELRRLPVTARHEHDSLSCFHTLSICLPARGGGNGSTVLPLMAKCGKQERSQICSYPPARLRFLGCFTLKMKKVHYDRSKRRQLFISLRDVRPLSERHISQESKYLQGLQSPALP